MISGIFNFFIKFVLLVTKTFFVSLLIAILWFHINFYLSVDYKAQSAALEYAQKHVREDAKETINAIKHIAASHRIKPEPPNKDGTPKYTQTLDFCEKFARDLTSMREIEEIPPVAFANYYNDKTFEKLHGQCSDLRLDVGTHYDSYLEEEFSLTGTNNFKAYVVDIDNEPSNGKEYVLYSERFYHWFGLIRTLPDHQRGIYQVANLENCTQQPEFYSGSSRFKYTKPEKTGSYSTIISYKGMNYFLDVIHAPLSDTLYFISLRESKPKPVCTLTIDQPEAVKAERKARKIEQKKKSEILRDAKP